VPGRGPGDATFFASPAEWRAWLEAHHADTAELLVGFHKKGSGLPSITWPEAVDQALCFGWIDGVRRSLDETSYAIRFTPRRPRSIWSAVNINRAQELRQQGLMHPTGIAAFERRGAERSGVYSFEQPDGIALSDALEGEFRRHPEAWEFFQTQTPSYRKAAIWWIVSAKRDATRRKRLETLITDSAQGRTVKHLTPPARRR
jgi:uncharacterized protein YdeI (YjbR/CyaY-like superfamily)